MISKYIAGVIFKSNMILRSLLRDTMIKSFEELMDSLSNLLILRFLGFFDVLVMFVFDVIWYLFFWCFSDVFCDIYRCFLMLYDVFWCFWCFLMFFDVFWCFLMFFDVFWCFLMFFMFCDNFCRHFDDIWCC